MNPRYLLFTLLLAACGAGASAQADAPSRSWGPFLAPGKARALSLDQTTRLASTLECRWSPQGIFLVCDQLVKLPGGDHHQFTAYSHNSKDNVYGYVTIPDPGAKPNSGKVEIKGNLWTYSSSFENNGKTMAIKTTNEFSDTRTEVFKTESSDDGGATWKTVLQGTPTRSATSLCP
jgi:hypothetical protein